MDAARRLILMPRSRFVAQIGYVNRAHLVFHTCEKLRIILYAHPKFCYKPMQLIFLIDLQIYQVIYFFIDASVSFCKRWFQ
jgi:hypothetical protein